MGLQLLPELSFCLVEDRVIFLDIARDRYFRLPEAAEHAFLELVDGAGGVAPADLPSGSPIAGLFRQASESVRPRPVAAPACTRAFIADPAGTSSVIRTGRALWGQLRASRLVRHRRLLVIIERLRSMRGGQRNTAGMEEIVRAHAVADLVHSVHDRCLAKSIALFIALRRSGCESRLIFGVMARPFAAHCWVQVDDMVVNGDVGLIRMFTPILVI